ncbi:MAG: hypothetical protein AAGF12_30860 [Myxococcota bacterium]
MATPICRRAMVTLAFLVALTSSPEGGFCRVARADRPSSSNMSLLSGRTIGNGQTALAAALGWPGIWALVNFAPSSTVNFSIKGTVLYGTPVMGLSTNAGGSVAVPFRVHLFAEGDFDLAAYVEPTGFVGEGGLAGQEGVFKNDLGFGFGGIFGALGGYGISDAVTLAFGLTGEIYYVSVPDADASEVVGAAVAIIGVEALISRDTMLFVEGRGGVGLGGGRPGGSTGPGTLFDGAQVLRLSIGLAYLL